MDGDRDVRTAPDFLIPLLHGSGWETGTASEITYHKKRETVLQQAAMNTFFMAEVDLVENRLCS
jgi:hypothetical protein